MGIFALILGIVNIVLMMAIPSISSYAWIAGLIGLILAITSFGDDETIVAGAVGGIVCLIGIVISGGGAICAATRATCTHVPVSFLIIMQHLIQIKVV